MKTKKLQTLFLILGFLFAIFAGYLSFQKGIVTEQGESGGVSYRGGVEGYGGSGAGASIYIAADGGATGFAILAGLCFVAVAITTLKSE